MNFRELKKYNPRTTIATSHIRYLFPKKFDVDKSERLS